MHSTGHNFSSSRSKVLCVIFKNTADVAALVNVFSRALSQDCGMGIASANLLLRSDQLTTHLPTLVLRKTDGMLKL